MSFRPFFTLASAVECRSIPSIKTLDRHPDRYLIDTQSTPQLILNQHSVDISIDSFGFDQGRAYLACVAGGSGCARETFCGEAANSLAGFDR